MPTFIRISPLRIWLAWVAAAPGWVASPDPHVRHCAHRWLGREFKRLVLAFGGREVGRNIPTGHSRGPMPVTSSIYEIDLAAMAGFDAALARLAGRIRGRT